MSGDFKPAETFPPGEFIRDELEARDMTQAELAFVLGRPQTTVNAIIAGRKAVTPETARGLAKAFGTSAEFWLNLESAYRLSLAEDVESEGAVEHRARLLTVAPVKDMVKRGWITGTDDADGLESELKAFFDTDDLHSESPLCAAARMSASYAVLTPAQRAWMFRAKNLARAVTASPFSRDDFRRGLPELRKYVASEHDVRRVPAFLAGLGVRLVLLEHLPKTKIDGATIWLDDAAPAVALSMRFDRIDWFWFTLCHELSHVLHKDGADGVDGWLVDDDLLNTGGTDSQEGRPGIEARADKEAAELLIPDGELDKFIMRVRPLYGKPKIIQFANRIKVHPGIIVGQLQRCKEIDYSHHRSFLTKVRESLSGAALTDGWGSVPPL